MGTKYATRHVRNPEEETMKRPNTIDKLILLGFSIVTAMMLTTGCGHTQTIADTRKCCARVDATSAEMDRFNRYCKVALFLAKSENEKAVGSKVKEGARNAVNICKFVFSVETDEELIAAGDQPYYYKVRSYKLSTSPDDGGWNHPNCDPSEMGCEEF
tara:strand:- start:718 stop:1191 length:474 start_codon:yes stop_codon:yes gene_type:complete